MPDLAPAPGRWMIWAGTTGFALGGFFDGILLHQILQWHHLLSLVRGIVGLRAQIVWDGYFHALMYVVAAAGLWGLWRTRRDAGPLAGPLLMGFGLWHVVDGVLSHWILGIHRVRLDTATPLLWDIAWFLAFGLVPLGLGRLLLRHRDTRGGAENAVLLAAMLALAMAGWSVRPVAGQGYTTIAFAPGVGAAQVVEAMRAADARLVWSDPAMSVIVVVTSRRWLFYRHGALLVSGAGLPAGCAGWAGVRLSS